MDALSITGAVDVEGSCARFAVFYPAEEPVCCGTVIVRGCGRPAATNKGPEVLIKDTTEIPSNEITDEQLHLHRREFIRLAGCAAVAAATAPLLGCSGEPIAAQPRGDGAFSSAQSPLTGYKEKAVTTDEKLNTFDEITGYNNFYEFGSGKSDPKQYSGSLKTSPWTVKIDGNCNKPADYHLEDLIKPFQLEERIYRLRCVEAWSMVIPWIGVPLSQIIKRAEPNSKAGFVEFTTLLRPTQMPGQQTSALNWPYTEGLRMDEAMHPLTILAVGLYGKTLMNQNGAPIRLVVPWKYGFKSIKSIVRIRFVEKQPNTAWNLSDPSEYGFYSNVNPEVDHPRWTQARERRIGTILPRRTLMFNGYGDQVASLYTGMDLRKYY
jgi:methionine sulfoxide reductase catalytic subunit